jgi:hypothetical protein
VPPMTLGGVSPGGGTGSTQTFAFSGTDNNPAGVGFNVGLAGAFLLPSQTISGLAQVSNACQWSFNPLPSNQETLTLSC